MKLRIYNTLTREKEDFEPSNGKEVRIYSCGPTVYSYAHIGNFRAYIFMDTLSDDEQKEIRKQLNSRCQNYSKLLEQM